MIKVTRGINKKDLSKISSAELVEDTKGVLYLSYIRSNASTGLLFIGEHTIIESSTVDFPVTKCPEGTSITISISKEGEKNG